MIILLKRFSFFFILPLLTLIACDSGGDNDDDKNYAGTYKGTGTYVYNWLDASISVDMSIRVIQSGNEVTITGSVTAQGQTTQLDAITGTVNSTGFLTVTGNGTYDGLEIPGCGAVTPVSGSLVFSSGSVRVTESANVSNCGLLSFSATLRKQ